MHRDCRLYREGSALVERHCLFLDRAWRCRQEIEWRISSPVVAVARGLEQLFDGGVLLIHNVAYRETVRRPPQRLFRAQSAGSPGARLRQWAILTNTRTRFKSVRLCRARQAPTPPIGSGVGHERRAGIGPPEHRWRCVFQIHEPRPLPSSSDSRTRSVLSGNERRTPGRATFFGLFLFSCARRVAVPDSYLVAPRSSGVRPSSGGQIRPNSSAISCPNSLSYMGVIMRKVTVSIMLLLTVLIVAELSVSTELSRPLKQVQRAGRYTSQALKRTSMRSAMRKPLGRPRLRRSRMELSRLAPARVRLHVSTSPVSKRISTHSEILKNSKTASFKDWRPSATIRRLASCLLHTLPRVLFLSHRRGRTGRALNNFAGWRMRCRSTTHTTQLDAGRCCVKPDKPTSIGATHTPTPLSALRGVDWG